VPNVVYKGKGERNTKSFKSGGRTNITSGSVGGVNSQVKRPCTWVKWGGGGKKISKRGAEKAGKSIESRGCHFKGRKTRGRGGGENKIDTMWQCRVPSGG